MVQKGMQAWLAPYAGWLLDVLTRSGREYTITSVYRSRAKQEQLYERWLAGLSPYPAAPPGRSLHEQGRAMDIVSDDVTLRQAGELWTRMGGTWGGLRDPIHFQA